MSDRRHQEVVAVEPAQGVGDGGGQVGATADRFGDEDLGPGGEGEALGGLDQRIEPAAETAAGNLLRRKTLRPEHRRVHQVAPLVVGDQPDPQALVREPAGKLADRGRFASAEEATDHDVAGLGRASRRGGSRGRSKHGGDYVS